jgi:Na+-driven multidrug efflux pump
VGTGVLVGFGVALGVAVGSKVGVGETVTIGVAVGVLELAFARELSGLFINADDPNKEAVIACSVEIMTVILSTYFLCGIMEVFMGILRGMGYSVTPMVISLIGACGLRIVWISFIFPLPEFYSLTGLMLCYPVTWIPTNIAFSIATAIAWRRLRSRKDDKKLSEPLGETAA